MMNPLPFVSQIYSTLIQEERQREVKGTAHFLVKSTSLSVDVHKGHQTGSQSFRKQFDRPELKFEKSEGKRVLILQLLQETRAFHR